MNFFSTVLQRTVCVIKYVSRFSGAKCGSNVTQFFEIEGTRGFERLQLISVPCRISGAPSRRVSLSQRTNRLLIKSDRN